MKNRESELRLATILFADISGFTSMSEKMSAEEVTMLMNECFEMMNSIIESNEGTVDKFIGDCVMVTFGAQKAIENAPHKAINTAIAIRNKIIGFNKVKKLSMPLSVHIGVNTGSVVSGLVGAGLKKEFTVMGDAVNLASRLEDASTAGQILVGTDTYKATEDLFEYNELKPILLKGKEQLVPVYELLSIKERVYKRKVSSDRMIHSVLVGRDDELSKLELYVLKVFNGEGWIVNVIGEAGIGKSRLIAELKNREIMQRITLLEGRALSIGRNLSFYPIIEFLKQWSDIKEDDGNQIQLFKLGKLVSEVHPDKMEEIIPYIAALMGIKTSDNSSEKNEDIKVEALVNLMMKNFREFIREATNKKPYAIILDDLQWADNSSIKLLEALFSLAETQKILFINVFRPQYEETSNHILEYCKEKFPNSHCNIDLRSLDQYKCELLIDNLLMISGLSSVIKNQIIEKAGGNPFFIEEVVRSFIDYGAIVSNDGQFKVTEQMDKVIIPQTINEVLMARIDQLEEETRNLIKLASVIGRNFFHKILVDIADSIDEIDQKLVYLKDIQLIRENKRMAEVEFFFKHSLAQQTAYESILIQKRKELHQKVAESIEKTFSERLHEFYGRLAFHFSTAGNLDKAEYYMEKAGEEALKSSASSEAISYYKNALEFYIKKYGEAVDPIKIAEMETNIVHAFVTRGRYLETVEYCDRAIKNLGMEQPKGFPKVFIIVNGIFQLIVNLYFSSQKPKPVPTLANEQYMKLIFCRINGLVVTDPIRYSLEYALVLKELFKKDISQSQVYINLLSGSGFLFSVGGISIKIGRKVLDYVQAIVSGESEKISLSFHKAVRTVNNCLSGNWVKDYDEDSINKDLAHGDTYTASFRLLWLGITCSLIGEFKTADKIAAKLNNISRDYNDLHAELDYYDVLFISQLQKRNLQIPKKVFERSKALTIQEGQNLRLLSSISYKANFEILQDEIAAFEQTKNEIDKEIKRLRKLEQTPTYMLLSLIPKIRFNLLKLEDAVQSQEFKIVHQFGKSTAKNIKAILKIVNSNPILRTESFSLFAIYYWLTNKQRKALKWFDKSITEGERLGARPELSRTYMEVGKRLLEPKSKYKQLNGITAEEYLEKARVLFEEMDLKWDLEQLEKVKTEMN